MDIGVISVRYARALLKSTTDAKGEEAVYRDMQMLSRMYIDVPALRGAADNPMLPKATKQKVLETAMGGNDAHKLSKAFLELVLKEDRENVLQFMANAYLTLYLEQKHIIRSKLTTAVPATEETQQRMRQLVESRAGGHVEFETATDPALMGGFILEYDTYRMDASVKAKLQAILATLKK